MGYENFPEAPELKQQFEMALQATEPLQPTIAPEVSAPATGMG